MPLTAGNFRFVVALEISPFGASNVALLDVRKTVK